MPDLLTHVLVGYSLGMLLAVRRGWSRRMITVVMLGALLPDLTKIRLVLPDAQVEAFLGVPFAWQALHTLGGVFVTAGVGALLVNGSLRRRVFGLLLGGALSHLILDSLLIKPSGYASPVWWPFLPTALPTPGLYVSFDRWPVVVAGAVAFVVYLWNKRRRTPGQSVDPTSVN
jgi:hypothetical protein